MSPPPLERASEVRRRSTATVRCDRGQSMEAALSRLTRKEIKELTKRLETWQSARAMRELVDGTMDRIGGATLFGQPGLNVLRDAWVAARLAEARQADCVRLIDDEWPDFEVKFGARVERFEAVEADNPDRRRGDEYRDAKKYGTR